MPRYLKCVTEGMLEGKAEVLAASFKGSKADFDQLILNPVRQTRPTLIEGGGRLQRVSEKD